MNRALLVAIVTLFSIGALSPCLSSSMQGNRVLDQAINIARIEKTGKAFRELNRLGERRDGDYAEYYGLVVMELIESDSVRCELIRYLIQAKKCDRNNLEVSIAQEIYIREGVLYSKRTKTIFSRRCLGIASKDRSLISNRIDNLIRSIVQGK